MDPTSALRRWLFGAAALGAAACSTPSSAPPAPAPTVPSAGAPPGSGSGAGSPPSGESSSGDSPSGESGSSSGGSLSAGDAGLASDGAPAPSQADAADDDAAAAPGEGGAAGLPKIAGTVDIMPLGDSITRTTCWRARLWQELNAAFPSRFHLVGTLSNDPGCGVASYDTANQGYSSSLVTEVVAGVTHARTCDPFCPALSDLATAFDAVRPNVVLMHYGTNDVWNGKSPSAIVSAYSAVVDALRAANPNVVVLLAQIIPMNVTSATCSGCACPSCPTAVPALNAQIAAWAPTKSTAASPIVVVDQYTGFDAVADTRDGVHPNSTTGSQKMADKWYAALAPLF